MRFPSAYKNLPITLIYECLLYTLLSSHYLLFHLSKVVGAGKLCTIPTQDVEGAIGRTTNLSVSERERELSRKREPHLQRPGGMALHHPPG